MSQLNLTEVKQNFLSDRPGLNPARFQIPCLSTHRKPLRKEREANQCKLWRGPEKGSERLSRMKHYPARGSGHWKGVNPQGRRKAGMLASPGWAGSRHFLETLLLFFEVLLIIQLNLLTQTEHILRDAAISYFSEYLKLGMLPLRGV